MISIELQKYLPTNCPECITELTFDGIHLMCPNETCPGRIGRKLSSGAGVLDLKGVGGQTLKPFAKDFLNLYELWKWVLINGESKDIEKYGIPFQSRSHEIFINAFKNIKSFPYEKLIQLFGYDNIGKSISKQLAREHAGLDFNYENLEKALVEKLHTVEIDSYIRNAVKELEALGVIIDRPVDKKNKNIVYVCMTGKPDNNITKEEFISKFKNIEQVSVTDKECQFLITNSITSVTSKMKNAEKKGVIIITYEDFNKKFNSQIVFHQI